MFKIDWLGLTATVVTDYAAQGIIIVDSEGTAIVAEQVEIEVTQVDLVDFVMDYFGDEIGPLMLESLLEVRRVMLSCESLMEELGEHDVVTG